jgi:hypothetical protein
MANTRDAIYRAELDNLAEQVRTPPEHAAQLAVLILATAALPTNPSPRRETTRRWLNCTTRSSTYTPAAGRLPSRT